MQARDTAVHDDGGDGIATHLPMTTHHFHLDLSVDPGWLPIPASCLVPGFQFLIS